jgi:predicted nucleic acid-binding protein
MIGDMKRRLLYTPVLHIDTNLINARRKLAAVNKLEKWFADGVILINMSGAARGEALAGGNAQRSEKANQQLFTMTSPAQPDEARFKAIESVLFPGGAKDENQKNDVRIVADAIHYAAILVTQDGGSKSQPGGILGNRDSLATRFAIRILTPDEAVAFVEDKIRERDDFTRESVRQFGGKLPGWTGKD